MRKTLSAAVAVLGLTAALSLMVLAGAAGADPGATVYQQCPTVGNDAITHLPNCEFSFWYGNGSNQTMFVPTAFHEVVTPSGNENEVIVGTAANDTGQPVTYGPDSGAPIPAGQTCVSFATDHLLPDWQLTIDASGNFTLICHSS